MRAGSGAPSTGDGQDRGAQPERLEQLEPGWRWKPVCQSADLSEGGDGVRFEVPGATEPAAAFVVRAGGVARAYLNRCSHVAVELDWQPGRFFDDSGLYLVCATHGAMYLAVDGRCMGGPCRGQGLVALRSRERGGTVWIAIRDDEA